MTDATSGRNEIVSASGADLADQMLGEADVSAWYQEQTREPLGVLIDAVRSDPDLPEAAVAASDERFRNDIAKVAALERDRRAHPDITAQAIEQPLFILGLPRTGTSILQALMGAVPGARTLRQWEVAHFSPPPESAPDDDPRIVAMDQAMSDPALNPIRVMHPIGPLQPSECGPLLESSFRSTHFCMDLRVAPYLEWYLEADNTPAYELHRQWLQHFQVTDPGQQWVCKIQEHMYHVPELLRVYPDALLVQPHRDPATVIASISSLIATLRLRTFGEVDPVALGREMLHLWGSGLAKFMAFRRANPDVRVCDVHYRDIVEDPAGTVGSIHDFFGLSYPSEAAAAVTAWWQANPKDGAGAHRYTLEDWGLTTADVYDYDAYEDYRTEFGAFL